MADLNSYLKILPGISTRHKREDILHKKLSEALTNDVRKVFGKAGQCKYRFNEIGEIVFPYNELGKVDSSGMFALDEMIVFSYYIKNRERYRNVLDIGGNLGIHSIVLGKLGANIKVFEPDPEMIKKLKNNLDINNIQNVEIIAKAISKETGTARFCRVCDNNAGSHISGKKLNPYGPLEYFDVETESITKYLGNIDYIKIDAEGSEADILCSIEPRDVENCDIFVEIGSRENAIRIYEHFKSSKMNLFCQTKNWQIAESHSDLPIHHTEGLLFISSKNKMCWE